MKLRTTSNSIRLRLSQTDVRNFVEYGFVRETIDIDPKLGRHFSYGLERSNAEPVMTVTYDNNGLTVLMPKAEADRWTNSEQVGVETKQTSNDLSILVEKDFACLEPRQGEDDRDTFPHPNAGRVC